MSETLCWEPSVAQATFSEPAAPSIGQQQCLVAILQEKKAASANIANFSLNLANQYGIVCGYVQSYVWKYHQDLKYSQVFEECGLIVHVHKNYATCFLLYGQLENDFPGTSTERTITYTKVGLIKYSIK